MGLYFNSLLYEYVGCCVTFVNSVVSHLTILKMHTYRKATKIQSL